MFSCLSPYLGRDIVVEQDRRQVPRGVNKSKSLLVCVTPVCVTTGKNPPWTESTKEKKDKHSVPQVLLNYDWVVSVNTK